MSRWHNTALPKCNFVLKTIVVKLSFFGLVAITTVCFRVSIQSGLIFVDSNEQGGGKYAALHCWHYLLWKGCRLGNFAWISWIQRRVNEDGGQSLILMFWLILLGKVDFTLLSYEGIVCLLSSLCWIPITDSEYFRSPSKMRCVRMVAAHPQPPCTAPGNGGGVHR